MRIAVRGYSSAARLVCGVLCGCQFEKPGENAPPPLRCHWGASFRNARGHVYDLDNDIPFLFIIAICTYTRNTLSMSMWASVKDIPFSVLIT